MSNEAHYKESGRDCADKDNILSLKQYKSCVKNSMKVS